MASVGDKQSVVDVISEAYSTLNRSWWILLTPFILNLLLWLVPGVSLAPLYEQFSALVRDSVTSETPEMRELRAQTLGLLAQLALDDVRPQFAWLNVVPYAIYGFRAAGASADALGLPFLVAVPAVVTPPDGWFIHNAGELFVLIIVVNTVGVLASATYLFWLSNASQQQPFMFDTTRILRIGAMLALYVLLLAAAVVILLVPLSIFTFLLLNINPAFGAFVIFLGSGVWLWVGIYLGFTREFIVLDNAGPVKAIQQSFRMVRRLFWRVLLFQFVIFVIVAGSGIIFTGFLATQLGQMIIVGISAYLNSGLAMARIAFVRNYLASPEYRSLSAAHAR
ncbi:MAG: hypothetical protein RI985_1310 [Chloroflexota bacterium]